MEIKDRTNRTIDSINESSRRWWNQLIRIIHREEHLVLPAKLMAHHLELLEQQFVELQALACRAGLVGSFQEVPLEEEQLVAAVAQAAVDSSLVAVQDLAAPSVVKVELEEVLVSVLEEQAWIQGDQSEQAFPVRVLH